MLKQNRKVGKYQLGKTIGSGTFGKVKYAVDTNTDTPRAIKIMSKSKIQQMKMGPQIKKEIMVMKIIAHPNVLNLVEVLASKTKIFIVLELVGGGELFDKIVAEGRLDDDRARGFFRQLVRGVGFCHSKGVYHRDLKPENLLVDNGDVLKISDFGLSALAQQFSGATPQDPDQLRHINLYHTTCGTPNYVAPEVLLKDGYDGALADIWSIGVILYVLLAGFLPFDEPTMPALFRKIVKAEYVCPKFFSDSAKDLLSKILVTDPSKRASIPMIMEHHWFVGPDNYHLDPENIIETLPRPFPLDENKEVVLPRSPRSARNAGLSSSDVEIPGTDSFMSAHMKNSEEIELDSDEEEEEVRASGPIAVTAFDLIHMVGGAALNNMFQRSQIKSYTQFCSNKKPEEIIDRIASVLADMNCKYRVLPRSAKIKVKLVADTKFVQFNIQLYEMAEHMHLVDFRKTQGDIFLYYDFYKQLHKVLFDIEVQQEVDFNKDVLAVASADKPMHSPRTLARLRV